jgi:hypothetical protein
LPKTSHGPAEGGAKIGFTAGWIPGRSDRGFGAKAYSSVESLEWQRMQNRELAGRKSSVDLLPSYRIANSGPVVFAQVRPPNHAGNRRAFKGQQPAD